MYRRLLTEILLKLDDIQLSGLLDEIGRESECGKELLKVLEEDCGWRSDVPFSFKEAKEILKKELDMAKGHHREFYKELIHFIDREQKTDSQVYNAIGMNRSLWYHLRDNKNARTSKRNVIKMAIVLRLDYWEMYYLINLSGYSLLPGDDDMDRIVAFCIRRKIYDQKQVDELLWEAGVAPLFSE